MPKTTFPSECCEEKCKHYDFPEFRAQKNAP